MKKVLVTGLAVFFLAAGFAWGQEERLTATLERETVSVGNPVYLNITFYGSKNISPPDLPQVEGLRIKYVGPATKISIVNGRVSQSIRHAYLVIPLEEGDFQIGPFEARYEGRVYEADPVVLIAREVPVTSPLRARKPRPASVSQYEEEPAARPYEGERAFIVMEVEKKEMYVNEVVPVTIKLYVDNLQLRDIEYPEFSHEGFSVGEMQKPERSMAVVRGLRYDALVFRRDIFGIKEGDYVLGPAQLRCKVLERVSSRRSSSAGRSIFDDDFFRSIMGRYQTYPLELRSKEIPVTILPFPKEGRPEDFRGAIGDFDMDVKVDPKKVKVGDPIVLR
ncbi:MAG: BatD family protein, partial [Candidatus Omnitrophota bacterium]